MSLLVVRSCSIKKAVGITLLITISFLMSAVNARAQFFYPIDASSTIYCMQDSVGGRHISKLTKNGYTVVAASAVKKSFAKSKTKAKTKLDLLKSALAGETSKPKRAKLKIKIAEAKVTLQRWTTQIKSLADCTGNKPIVRNFVPILYKTGQIGSNSWFGFAYVAPTPVKVTIPGGYILYGNGDGASWCYSFEGTLDGGVVVGNGPGTEAAYSIWNDPCTRSSGIPGKCPNIFGTNVSGTVIVERTASSESAVMDYLIARIASLQVSARPRVSSTCAADF